MAEELYRPDAELLFFEVDISRSVGANSVGAKSSNDLRTGSVGQSESLSDQSDDDPFISGVLFCPREHLSHRDVNKEFTIDLML